MVALYINLHHVRTGTLDKENTIITGHGDKGPNDFRRDSGGTQNVPIKGGR